MRNKDTKILEEMTSRLYEQSMFEEYTGDYGDVMFYADYDTSKMENIISQEIPVETKYIAQGDDLIKKSMNAESGKVYIFDRPTDFTQIALVPKS